MGIHHCFEAGAVVSELSSTEKFSALRELIRRAPVFMEIGNLDEFEQSVVGREKIQSTGFGHGVAVAHGRIEGLPRVIIGLGVSKEGIPFNAPDGAPVRLLFVIASPKQTGIDYLQALSTLVRVIRDCSLRDALLAAMSGEDIEKTIRSAFRLSLEERVERIACTNPT